MIILGVDPGTAITGIGVVKKEGNKIRPLYHGVIRTKSTDSLPERLRKIYVSLEEIIEKYRPEEMAVEELFFNKNTKTAFSVGQARGVILLAGVNGGLNISEYTPLQVKQAVVGFGRAEKIQVQKMVKVILGLKSIPRPDDAADALAIAICHANSLEFNKLLLNK